LLLLLRFLIYARPNEFQFTKNEKKEEKIRKRHQKDVVGISKCVHTHTSGCKLNVGVSCVAHKWQTGKWANGQMECSTHVAGR